MSEHQQQTPSPTLSKRPFVLLPAIATAALLGLAVYASRATVARSSPSATTPQAGEKTGDDKATAKAVEKADAFLKTLDEQQRGKVLLDYDSKKRSSWSNLPVTMVARNGVRLGELTKAQRAAALELIGAV